MAIISSVNSEHFGSNIYVTYSSLVWEKLLESTKLFSAISGSELITMVTHFKPLSAQTLGLWVQIPLEALVCVFSATALSCTGGLVASCSLAQGVLPTDCMIKKL
jgi:hypothetical protein